MRVEWDLAAPLRHGRSFALGSVDINRVVGSLTEKLTPLALKMANEISPLHSEMVPRVSLMTPLPPSASSDNCLFDSRIN